MSKPWMKFYPADWRSDPALRSVSMAARGLWMEMLCIMHEAEPYGHLVIKGRPVTDVMLASLAGIGLKECRNLLASLRQLGVFSASDEGVIYSRRMVKDHAKALKDKENGKLGGNPEVKRGVNPQVKAQKPEARDQIPDSSDRTVQTSPETEADDNRAAVASGADHHPEGKYEFACGVIRLNSRDFAAWERSYPSLNLRSELRSLAQWAGEQGNWWLPVQAALAKREREARLAVERIKAEAIARAAAPRPKPSAYVC